MNTIETLIKNFCIKNTDSVNIDFTIFKDPKDLYAEFGKNRTKSQFKGDIMEMLLEELFLGNGYRVQRLGEGGQDEGCDLLVRYIEDGSIRFVLQAKNWNKHIDKYDVKKEYAKFYDNYKGRLNLNTTHFCFVSWAFVREIKEVLTHELNIKVWDEDDIVSNLLRNYKPRHPDFPTLILEPYQETSFEKVLQFWNENKRCYVEHASGTGKTYIIARLVQSLLRNPDNRIMISSPSIYINDRIAKLLEKIISSKHISRTLEKQAKIYLLTYQHLMHRAAKVSSKIQFSHIIMDEAHRAGAPSWHTRGLLNVIGEDSYIVGLSATMQRYSDGIDIKAFLENNCAGKLTLFEGMARGILPIGDYVYSVKDVKDKVGELSSGVRSKYEKVPEKQKSLLDKLNTREIKDYSIQKVIYKYYHKKEYRKIIAFCEDIGHTFDIQALLMKIFIKFSNVRRFEVHSGSSRKENTEQLEKFSNTKPKKNEIFLLTAVDMLNEGIDVAGIDSVMLFRRTESPRVYLQQIGRCIRRHGVEHPLIFDCVLNYQNVDIKFVEEAKKALDEYRKALDEFGFEDVDIPKTIQIYDEVASISKIIQEVEKRLNFYSTYEEAKAAVKELGINSKEKYVRHYKEDPRLPTEPNEHYKNRGWINWSTFFDKLLKDFYPTYEQAKGAVKNLVIKNYTEYKQRYKEDPKLTRHPNRLYKDKGWIDWYAFLDQPIKYLYPTYEEAKVAVGILKIVTPKDYLLRHKEDPNLPAAPDVFYENKGWISWTEFLGKPVKNFYPTYEEAKATVKGLGFKTPAEYRLSFKEDSRLPANPERFYKGKGWINWTAFFDKPAKNLYSYQEAKEAVRRLVIKSPIEYKRRHKEDPSLPAVPYQHYKDQGWIDWYAFLDQPKKYFYLTYQEAKTATKLLGINTQIGYSKNHKKDPRLPVHPSRYYEHKGWANWREFFDKSTKDYYSTYEEAKKAVARLKISIYGEYKRRYKEDQRLPSQPNRSYRNKGWIDWSGFFDRSTKQFYSSFIETKQAIKRLGIKNQEDYRIHYKEDSRLPSAPNEFYKDTGWKNWSDLFGKLPKTPYTYREAKRVVRQLGIRSISQYKKRYKEDLRLFANPDRDYQGKGWIDWYDFFDTRAANLYSTIEEAKQAIRKLGIESQSEYKKRYRESPMLPFHPDRRYKNKGWINWRDFLGEER